MIFRLKILWVFFFFFLMGLSFGQNKVTIPECNCIVNIPGKFKAYLDTVHTEIGNLSNFTYVMKDTSLTFYLSFVEYPPGSMHSDSSALMPDFFQSTIEESVLKTKGVKRYASEITQFGYAGWFWKVNFGKNKFMKTKAFMAGRRFYYLQVMGDVKYDVDKNTFRYFDSFQFIDLAKVK